MAYRPTFSPAAPLAPEAISAAMQLLRRCNEAEHLALPIEIEAPADGTGRVTGFAVRDGASLVGYAWLPSDPEPEGCLMVDPGWRRRGIGRMLLGALRDEAARRGLGAFLVVADQAAPAAAPFLAATGGDFAFAEYQMVFDPAGIDAGRPSVTGLDLRLATAADLETLARLRASAFDDPLDESRRHVAEGFQQGNRRYYLATLDGGPVGMLRTGDWGDQADLTSFGVLPEARGRGIGRQMLRATIERLRAEGWERIVIEVATDNAHALGLYESCGFRIERTYGYYRVLASPVIQDR